MATTTIRRPKTEDEPTRADTMRHDSPTVANDEIARRAYELYEERGREPGHALDDWLQAEHDIRQRHAEE